MIAIVKTSSMSVRPSSSPRLLRGVLRQLTSTPREQVLTRARSLAGPGWMSADISLSRSLESAGKRVDRSDHRDGNEPDDYADKNDQRRLKKAGHLLDSKVQLF